MYATYDKLNGKHNYFIMKLKTLLETLSFVMNHYATSCHLLITNLVLHNF